MVIQRSCFFLTWAGALVLGGFWGIAGGAYFFERLLPGLINLSPVEALGFCLLLGTGGVMGALGAIFVVIMPLYFKFPNARKPFSWESKEPPIVFTFYHWYGTELAAFAAARRRGEH